MKQNDTFFLNLIETISRGFQLIPIKKYNPIR